MKRTSLEHFRRLFAQNRALEICDRQYHSLVAHYGQPHRKYHTLAHVERSLQLFDEVRPEAEDAFAMEAALWFHDVIYEVSSHENEEASAALCRDFLSATGTDRETIERTCRNILATSLNMQSESPDEQLMRDIDIAIFGSPEETFDEYEEAIGQEYSFVEEQKYIAARFQVLKSFLLKKAVYKTPHFFHECEAQARRNILRSLFRLFEKTGHTLSSDGISLSLRDIVVPQPGGELCPYYHFSLLTARDETAGHINFRIGDTRHILLCAGHIGFAVCEPYQGNHYSTLACRALIPLIRLFYETVVITAAPENRASCKCIERLGAVFQEEIEVPSDDPSYQGGARRKRRYLWTVPQ